MCESKNSSIANSYREKQMKKVLETNINSFSYL